MMTHNWWKQEGARKREIMNTFSCIAMYNASFSSLTLINLFFNQISQHLELGQMKLTTLRSMEQTEYRLLLAAGRY